MNFPKRSLVFKIRVIYKSGYTHDFEASSFQIKNGNYSWNSLSDLNKPLLLGADEIAAIWQVGARHTWSF
jgi:hypothetical protein